jgi:hypothetical protein
MPEPKLYGYIALYHGLRFEVYAETSYKAYLAAVEHFKPRKSARHLVTVHLCETPDGEAVIQVADT